MEEEGRRPRTRTALTRPTRRSCRRMIRTRMEAEAECPQNDLSQEIRGRRKCMKGEGDGGGDVAKVRWGQCSLVHVCPAVSILVIVWLSRLHARINGGTRQGGGKRPRESRFRLFGKKAKKGKAQEGKRKGESQLILQKHFSNGGERRVKEAAAASTQRPTASSAASSSAVSLQSTIDG